MFNPQLTVQQKLWATAKATEIANAGKPAGSFKQINPDYVTTSKLRRDTQLASGAVYSGISFNGVGIVPNASEILLGQNDAFLVTGLKLSVKKLAAATATEALHKAARDFTYPNTFVFDGTNETANIFAIWNSTLSVTQNSSVRFPKLYTGDFLFAPDNQYGDITAVLTGPTYSRKMNDSKNGPNYGYTSIEPFLLVGTDQTNFTLNIGAALNMTETNELNYFTISLDGWLISGN